MVNKVWITTQSGRDLHVIADQINSNAWGPNRPRYVNTQRHIQDFRWGGSKYKEVNT